MSNDWKEKYLNKLEQLETKEKDWSVLDEFLRQTSSRLALAAEGSSPKLDKLLPVLRKSLRKGESMDKLSGIMDDVSAELLIIDKLKANQPDPQSSFLANIIKNLSTTPEMDKKSQKILKLLSAKKFPGEDKLIKEFSSYFNHCLTISHQCGVDGKDNPSQSGFFGRLFNSLSKEEALNQEKQQADDDNSSSAIEIDSETDLSPEDIEQEGIEQEDIEHSITSSLQNILEVFIDSLDYPLAQKNLLKEQLVTITPTKDSHVLLEDLAKIIRQLNLDNGDGGATPSFTEAHEILIRLLEFIPLKDNLKQQADELKKNFSKGIKQSDIPAALEQIAKLISQMQQDSHQEQKEFENFLVNMTGKLKEVDQFLSTNLSEHKDSWQKGVALGNSVTEQVKGIGLSISSATDLKSLENDVKNKITHILTHVESYKKNENHRVKRIQQQNQLLKDKINQLEEESGHLKTKIITSQQRAYTDTLTGLPNRLAYEQHLSEEYARWQRYHENLLFMIWDIDFFKKVNDNHGHQAGDEVLTTVAQLLEHSLRETDFTARFGGEEFVSLMPNTSLGGGYKIAEKVRNAVEDLVVNYKGERIALTISCGICLFGDGDTPTSVFERADKALYLAKEQGRNRCVIAQQH